MLLRGFRSSFCQSLPVFSVRSSTNVSRENIRHYVPRVKTRIAQYKEATTGIKFTTEEEERSHPERVKLDEFFQKQSRTLMANYEIKEISDEFFRPLYSEIDLKYLATCLELSDLLPKFLVPLVEHTVNELKLNEDEIRTLYKGGVINYNAQEFLEFICLWEKESKFPEKDNPDYGYIWGQRIGAIVPVVNTKYLQLVVRPLITEYWFREIPWIELYKKQEKRLDGWYDEIEQDYPIVGI